MEHGRAPGKWIDRHDQHRLARGSDAVYLAALPLSSKTLNYVAGIIHRHRRAIGSPWRRMNPGRQAPLVLAHLRKGDTFAGLAARFGAGTSTV